MGSHFQALLMAGEVRQTTGFLLKFNNDYTDTVGHTVVLGPGASIPTYVTVGGDSAIDFGGSAYPTNGGPNGVQILPIADLNPLALDFTLEGTWTITARSDRFRILSKIIGTGFFYSLEADADGFGNMFFTAQFSTGPVSISSLGSSANLLTYGSTYHLRLSRIGNNFEFWVNGVSRGTTSNSYKSSAGTATVDFGNSMPPSIDALVGSISWARYLLGQGLNNGLIPAEPSK